MTGIKTLLLIITAFVLFLPSISIAQDDVKLSSAADISDHPWSTIEDEDGLAYRIQGADKEKGVWNLFVKNKSLRDDESPIANDLNAIEPAAGVQFNLEF